jgi:hypothetical protein
MMARLVERALVAAVVLGAAYLIISPLANMTAHSLTDSAVMIAEVTHHG